MSEINQENEIQKRLEPHGILIQFENDKDAEAYFCRNAFPKKACRVQRASNLTKYVMENDQLKSENKHLSALVEEAKILFTFNFPVIKESGHWLDIADEILKKH